VARAHSWRLARRLSRRGVVTRARRRRRWGVRARRHACSHRAVAEGATRTFQGQRVGELVLGALLEDLRGARGKRRSVAIADRRVAERMRRSNAARRSGRERRVGGARAEASHAPTHIENRRDNVGHLRTRRDASRARARVAEARCWFFLAGCRVRSGKLRARMVGLPREVRAPA
jgi:hypothetical protein